jgi:hypothetical protein
MLTDRTGSDAELIDRLHTLRSILPAMAAETARARRESARLRNENLGLQQRLAAIESGRSARPARPGRSSGVVMPLTPGD